MKSILRPIQLYILIACTWIYPAHAQSPSNYFYLSHTEQTIFNEFLFWLPTQFGHNDTIRGQVRSNSGLHFNGASGVFLNGVQAPSIEGDDNIVFRGGRFEQDNPYRFPRTLANIRNNAFFTAESHNNRFITRIKLLEDQGIEIHQYPSGQRYRDSVIWRSPPIAWGAVFVNGDCEVKGTLIGKLTIGCSGDMWLVDNIRYSGANDVTGRFGETYEEMRWFPHMLALASERNIIIKNTPANGRENGIMHGPNRHDRHSIVIDAALIALNESFTFEHQNDDFELYQGPTPDERGIIYLTGSIMQYRRGYLHRTNHQGTGYGTDFLYDARFPERPPLFFSNEYFPLDEHYDRLELVEGPYLIRHCTVGSLIIHPGVTVRMDQDWALTVQDSLTILGTEEEPVNFEAYDNRAGCRIQLGDHPFSIINIDNCRFSEDINPFLYGENVLIKNSIFESEVELEGSGLIDSCEFQDGFTITGWDDIYVHRSLFKQGLYVTGNPELVEIKNCTIVGSHDAGITLHRYESAHIVNNIITANREGILNLDRSEPDITYCNIFDNYNENYVNCEPGEGCISTDPLFIDLRSEDYHLWFNSPCLDAGEPDSPLDPDGSIADIGAYYINKRLDIKDVKAVPDEFSIAAYPNPFNSSTTIEYRVGSNSNSTTLSLYDLSGRLVQTLVNERLTPGNYRTTLNANNLATGMYFLRLEAGEHIRTEKVMLLR